MEIMYVYSKRRSEFGRQCSFSDRPPEILCDIPFDPILRENFIDKNPVDIGIDCVPSYSEHECNTSMRDVHNRGVNHLEGGWPKDINPLELEQVVRYRKKVEKEEGYIRSMTELARRMENCIKQNNAIDLYEEFFEGIPHVEAFDKKPAVKIMNIFKDPNTPKRPAVHITWYPDGPKKIAVAYSDHAFEGNFKGPFPRSGSTTTTVSMATSHHDNDIVAHISDNNNNSDVNNRVNMMFGNMGNIAQRGSGSVVESGGCGEDCPHFQSFIWDVENSNHPDFTLNPPSPLCCLEFSPKDSHLLIGGLQNGQVTLFDTRKSSRPCEVTHIESCHRDRVSKILWIASKIGTECFSASVDGQVLWWDTRKLNEPLEQMCLDTTKRQNIQTADGALCLEYEATMPTKFMVGTEQGHILTCNRKAKSVMERVCSVHTGHVGQVKAIQRNPFFLKNFLSVGDWTAKIWVEDHKESPIWSSRYGQHYFTDGCWSPTRAGVILTTRSDGIVEFWDVIHKQKESVLKVKVTDESLECMRLYDNGQTLAVGSREGLVMLYSLNDSLYVQDKNEKTAVSNMLEREAKREKILESKHREFRTKERIKSSRSATDSIPKSASSVRAPPVILTNLERDDEWARGVEGTFWDVIEIEKKRSKVKNDDDDDAGGVDVGAGNDPDVAGSKSVRV